MSILAPWYKTGVDSNFWRGLKLRNAAGGPTAGAWKNDNCKSRPLAFSHMIVNHVGDHLSVADHPDIIARFLESEVEKANNESLF